MQQNQRIHLLGSYLDPISMDETLRRIENIIEAKEPTQHVVINAGKINLMQQNSALKEIVNQSPLINADGQSIVWAARFLGYQIPERVTGIDLFEELVKRSEKTKWRLYYLGAKEEVVQKVVETHKRLYPHLNIVGYHNGYFSKAEGENIAREIEKAQADILFVAFSSPNKEMWIKEFQPIMKVPFAMGVGGSFDVVAGITNRAPKWMQKLGLEWFYRFIQEPKRMFGRYIIGNFLFVKLVIQEKWRMKRG